MSCCKFEGYKIKGIIWKTSQLCIKLRENIKSDSTSAGFSQWVIKPIVNLKCRCALLNLLKNNILTLYLRDHITHTFKTLSPCGSKSNDVSKTAPWNVPRHRDTMHLIRRQWELNPVTPSLHHHLCRYLSTCTTYCMWIIYEVNATDLGHMKPPCSSQTILHKHSLWCFHCV